VRRLAVLGASGHGAVVAELAELNGWSDIVFFDDSFPKCSTNRGWQVQGTMADLIASIDDYPSVIVAVGNNQIRLKKSRQLLSQRFKLETLIHPRSTVSKYANIKEGTVVMAGAVINPFVSIGLSSIINTACSIDHDCVIGEGVHISPGSHVAGGVSIGDLSWLGIGSVVKQSVDIGSLVTVGAGAVVVNDILDGAVVKGVPAK